MVVDCTVIITVDPTHVFRLYSTINYNDHICKHFNLRILLIL